MEVQYDVLARSFWCAGKVMTVCWNYSMLRRSLWCARKVIMVCWKGRYGVLGRRRVAYQEVPKWGDFKDHNWTHRLDACSNVSNFTFFKI